MVNTLKIAMNMTLLKNELAGSKHDRQNKKLNERVSEMHLTLS
jgi:hypothetical protein